MRICRLYRLVQFSGGLCHRPGRNNVEVSYSAAIHRNSLNHTVQLFMLYAKYLQRRTLCELHSSIIYF